MHQYSSNSNCSIAVDSDAVFSDPLLDTFELFELLTAFTERLLLFTLDELFTCELLMFFRRPVDL